MKAENEQKKNKKMGEKPNYIDSLRKNLDRIMEERDLTIKELAEMSDITFETFRGFLYDKEAKDCRLSTVVKLSKALEIPVGLLAGTLDEETAELLVMYRSLPQSSRSLINWHIRNQSFIHSEHDRSRPITIMKPICSNNGNLKRTYEYEKFDTSGLDEELYHKVFFGIRVPCDHYLPLYKENDILLIANDRNAMKNENSVILIDDNILITKRVVENDNVLYYGVRDNELHAKNQKSVELIGYIAKVISE